MDTGPWIFGKKVMLPAGVIDRVDLQEEKVFVNRNEDEIKNAPEYDDALFEDETYRGEVGSYYGPGGAGYRDWDRPGIWSFFSSSSGLRRAGLVPALRMLVRKVTSAARAPFSEFRRQRPCCQLARGRESDE